MTQANITEFLSKYVTGKSAERIGKMIYDLYGAPSESGQSNPIPPGGVVKAFNDAVLGPDVKDDIVKLSLLIKGLMGETITETEELKDAAEAAADELRETYSKIDFKSDGVHFGDELFIDPRDGGSSQSVIHGQRTLNSNDNLDDIFTQGFYFFRGGIIHPPTEEDPSVGNVPVGSPTNSMSLLIVFATNGGTVISQIILNGGNRLYFRTKTGSAEFTEWKRMMDRTDPNVPTDQECIDAGANILPFIYTQTSFANSGIELTWIAKTASDNGYWKLVVNSAPESTVSFNLAAFPSVMPIGFLPGKEYRVGLKCDIDGQPYIDDGTHPIYLRVVEKIQNHSDINHYFYSGESDVNLTLNEACIGVVIVCGIKKDSTFSGDVKFQPSIRAARTNAELTEKTKRIRVRKIAADDPEAQPLTGLYFDVDKMFVGAETGNNKELLHYQRTLTSSDLLADINEAGIYAFKGSDRPPDSPTIHTSVVWAICSPTGKYRSLILLNDANRVYHNAWDGAAWTGFTRIMDRGDDSGGGSSVVGTADSIAIGTGRDVPQNAGVLNAYKRAHQLLDVLYPADGIYLTTGDKINSANPYAGVPHSSVKEAETFVGTDVSLRTFMTAAHNAYSLLHTEYVRNTSDHSGGISKYGMYYRGNAQEQGAYYGTSCSQFVFSALGISSRWINANFNYLVREGILYRISEDSSMAVRLMDIIQETNESGKPTHCTMVTDIYRNNRGVPTHILVSQSSPSRRMVQWDDDYGCYVDGGNEYYNVGDFTRVYTREEFDDYLATKNGHIYRYAIISQNLDYKQSPFVTVDDETPLDAYVYNDDIMTYAGDYAAFRAGFPVHINYRKDDPVNNYHYTQLVITRDGSTVGTVNLPVSYNDTHSVDISSYCELAGLYTAELTDGTHNSEATYWEIIDTSVFVSGEMSNLTVTFNSDANPLYVEFVSERGNQWGLYELSTKEKQAGTITVNAVDYIKSTIGQAYVHSAAETYVRVIYKGYYGRVASRMINVDNPAKTLGIDDGPQEDQQSDNQQPDGGDE